MYKPSHLPEGPSNQQFPSRLKALAIAFALSLTSCISPQHTPPTQSIARTEEVCDDDALLDDPVFIALVGISAEVQGGIESNPKNCSLQYVWENVSTRLKEMKLPANTISVSLCSPMLTERGYAYLLIEVGKQQTQIFASTKKIAQERTLIMQNFCIEYIGNRINTQLGGNATDENTLRTILTEKDVQTTLSKHRIHARVVPDKGNITTNTGSNTEIKNTNAWTIAFDAET